MLKPNRIGNSSVCAIFAHTGIEERINIGFKATCSKMEHVIRTNYYNDSMLCKINDNS